MPDFEFKTDGADSMNGSVDLANHDCPMVDTRAILTERPELLFLSSNYVKREILDKAKRCGIEITVEPRSEPKGEDVVTLRSPETDIPVEAFAQRLRRFAPISGLKIVA